MKKVDEIRSFTNNMSNGTTLKVLNEAIQDATTIEERLELLVFKCMILEDSVYGKTFN